MKQIAKLFPVALGLLSIASCSNEDLFSTGSQAESSKMELIATLEAPSTSDDAVTRSATVPAEAIKDYQTVWQAGDVFRVYDDALQKYDAFSCKEEAGTKKITLDGEAAVDKYSKAIFPGKNVSYAGWSSTNKAVTATMYINPDITYGGTEVGSLGGKDVTGYVSNIPCWGEATADANGNLQVSLKSLVSYTDITVYKGAAKYIRVISTNPTNKAADIAQPWANNSAILGDPDATTGVQKAPLTGYFDALLVEGGKLVADLAAPLKDKFGPYIGVNLTGITTDEAHVFIPIVAQKYADLIIQYSTDGNAGNWTTLAEYTTYASKEMPNNAVIRKNLVIGEPPITSQVTSLKDFNEKLATIASTASYAGKIVSMSVAEGSKVEAIEGDGAEANRKIIIPKLNQFNKDLILNFNGTIGNSYANIPIEIVDDPTAGVDNTGRIVKLNIKGGIKGSENIIINTNAKVVLGGEFTSTGTTATHNTIDVRKAGALTLGIKDDADFSTTMNVKVADGINVTVDAFKGVGTIAAIDASAATNTNNITVNGGTVTAIGGKVAAATPVIVEKGATVPTIKTTTGNVTVKDGATVTDVTTGAAANVNISASLNSLTTASPAVTVSSGDNALTITTLTMKNATDATLGLNSTNNKLAKITTLASEATAATTVTAAGAAAIVNVSTAAGKKAPTFATSSLTDAAAKQKTTEINTKGEIYTAAQLAGVTTGNNYKLMTAIDLNDNDWTAVNLNGDFDGNNKTISNVNKASLFGVISGGTIKNLTVSSVKNNADVKSDKGGLASSATGTVTLNKVVVLNPRIGKGDAAAADYANTANYGGLFGKVNGTITIIDSKVDKDGPGTSIMYGFANMGGLIGNVQGGIVNILTTKADATYQSKIIMTNKAATTASGTKFGTIGNLIGSVTGSNVTIKVGAAGTDDDEENAGKLASCFFVTTGTNTYGILKAGDSYSNWTNHADKRYNKNTNAGKAFIGMQGTVTDVESLTLQYEIGYSTGSISSLTLYDNTKDKLGNPFTLKIANINQYAN